MTRTMRETEARSLVNPAQGTDQTSECSISAPHFRCKPRLTLEIIQTDGQTRMLNVDFQQCFIGSDEDCELRLVHPKMPPVVAVIRVLNDGVWIESCRNSGDLLVNHVVIRQSWIKDGDEIGIFPFVLKAHLRLNGTPAALERATEVQETSVIKESVFWEEPDLSRLSPSELIDHIESDLNLIEQDELRRREGADTLLRAIRARQAAIALDGEPSVIDKECEELSPARISIRLQTEESTFGPENPRDLIDHLASLIEDLSSVLQKLHVRDGLTESGIDIDSLLLKLRTIDVHTPTPHPRAIA